MAPAWDSSSNAELMRCVASHGRLRITARIGLPLGQVSPGCWAKVQRAMAARNPKYREMRKDAMASQWSRLSARVLQPALQTTNFPPNLSLAGKVRYLRRLLYNPAGNPGTHPPQQPNALVPHQAPQPPGSGFHSTGPTVQAPVTANQLPGSGLQAPGEVAQPNATGFEVHATAVQSHGSAFPIPAPQNMLSAGSVTSASADLAGYPGLLIDPALMSGYGTAPDNFAAPASLRFTMPVISGHDVSMVDRQAGAFQRAEPADVTKAVREHALILAAVVKRQVFQGENKDVTAVVAADAIGKLIWDLAMAAPVPAGNENTNV